MRRILALPDETHPIGNNSLCVRLGTCIGRRSKRLQVVVRGARHESMTCQNGVHVPIIGPLERATDWKPKQAASPTRAILSLRSFRSFATADLRSYVDCG